MKRSLILNGFKFKWQIGDKFHAGRSGSDRVILAISKGKVYSANRPTDKKINWACWWAGEIIPVGSTAQRFHDEFLAYLTLQVEETSEISDI